MANSNAGKNGKKSRFSRDKQPSKRGRPKSLFGPLSKENNLSLDDIRKVYKNILASKFEDLDLIKIKFPSVLTDMTIDLLKQDRIGRLSGKKARIKVKDEDTGKDVIKEVDERIKSYETIKLMIITCFGEPSKAENVPTDFETPDFIEDELEA